MSDDVDIDDLVNEHKENTGDGRTETEPTSTDDDTPSLEAAVADAYDAIDDGEANELLSTRDRNLSALFTALEQSGRLEPIGEQATSELGRADTPDSQSQLFRVLVRYALADIDADVLAAGADGLKTHKRRMVERETDQIDESGF